MYSRRLEVIRLGFVWISPGNACSSSHGVLAVKSGANGIAKNDRPAIIFAVWGLWQDLKVRVAIFASLFHQKCNLLKPRVISSFRPSLSRQQDCLSLLCLPSECNDPAHVSNSFRSCVSSRFGF
jgi:hypothetical protein